MKGDLRWVILVLGLMCIARSGYGQKNDYNWLTGYDALHPTLDTRDSVYWANTLLDFNYSPVQLSLDSLQMNFSFTNTTISDSNGNLLFYTNGIYIANALNEKIENSSGLNAGWLIDVWDPTIASTGYRNSQGIIAIPDVSLPDHYYLFHTLGDSLPGDTSQYTPQVLYTYLDMSANNGLGNVIYKNQILINDSIDGVGEELTAARHGNGKDWWIIVKKQNSNCYYRILLDETGPHVLPELNCGGFYMIQGDVGATCFSPDGSKYVYLNSGSGVNLFNFDRCTGLLSNPDTLPLRGLIDSGWWKGIGVAISPNNRFLYVSVTKQLYQIDLLDSNSFSKIDTVGIYDGYSMPREAVLQTLFSTPQIAPDGKIYFSCGNAVPYYHVINNPDLKGDSCNFVQRGLALEGYAYNIPNYPNYRLGPLVGSGCDTLTGLGEVARAAKEAVIKVYPNPTSDYVVVDYGFTDWSKLGTVSLEIVNELGQMVYKQPLPQYSGYQKLDVAKFAAGVYTVFIKRNTQVIAASKFAKTAP